MKYMKTKKEKIKQIKNPVTLDFGYILCGGWVGVTPLKINHDITMNKNMWILSISTHGKHSLEWINSRPKKKKKNDYDSIMGHHLSSNIINTNDCECERWRIKEKKMGKMNKKATKEK